MTKKPRWHCKDAAGVGQAEGVHHWACQQQIAKIRSSASGTS